MSDHPRPLAIGVDFGGTSVKFGVVRGAAVIEAIERIPTRDDTSRRGKRGSGDRWLAEPGLWSGPLLSHKLHAKASCA